MKPLTAIAAIAIAGLCATAQPAAAEEIRTGAGLCLDAHAPDMGKNGGRVQAWVCNGSPQQRWTYDPAARAVRLSSGLCLDAHAPDMTTNGGRVQLWVCNGSRQQQWTPLANTSLRNAGGFCLDVHGADQTRKGARVQVWQCNASQQQRFAFGPISGAPSASGQGPGPATQPVEAMRQWRVENSDTVNGNEPYELHNMRRRALNLTSQLGARGDHLEWAGSSGGHFIFRRTNERDFGPMAEKEVVALYNTKTKRYLRGGRVDSDGSGESWTDKPSYVWMVRDRVGADFALYNFSAQDYLVLGEATNGSVVCYPRIMPSRCK